MLMLGCSRGLLTWTSIILIGHSVSASCSYIWAISQTERVHLIPSKLTMLAVTLLVWKTQPIPFSLVCVPWDKWIGDGRKVSEGFMNERVTAVRNWSSVLLGTLRNSVNWTPWKCPFEGQGSWNMCWLLVLTMKTESRVCFVGFLRKL